MLCEMIVGRIIESCLTGCKCIFKDGARSISVIAEICAIRVGQPTVAAWKKSARISTNSVEPWPTLPSYLFAGGF